MRVACSIKSNTITFRIFDYQDETVGVGQVGKEIELINDTFRYILPVPHEDFHPDILALVVLSVLQPYISKEVEMPFPVSAVFAKAANDAFGVTIVNVSESLQPRKPGSRYALSFSGGADSVACSVIMPEDTVKITYLRTDHPDVEPRVDGYRDNQIAAVSKFDDVVKVDSDMEYISGPFLQWPTWVALSTPAFLMADHLGLRGIAYGLTTGFHTINRGKGRLNGGWYFQQDWRTLYEAVGLEMVLPVCGLTEHSTMTISYREGLLDKCSSCQIGEGGRPCNQCIKCLRKELLSYSIGAVPWSSVKKKLPQYYRSKQVQERLLLASPPINEQYLYMHVLGSKKFILDRILRLVRQKIMLSSRPDETSWVTKHNQRDFDVNHGSSELSEYMRDRINRHIKPMTAQEEAQLDRWDLMLAERYSDKDTDRINSKIERLLLRHK